LKFAICNELFEGWEFERVCRFVKSIGYDGVELAPFTLANPITAFGSDRRATLRRQAADHGVEIIGLHWLLAKTQVSSVIFGARTVEQVDDNLKAADLELGAEQLQRLDEASKFELGYPYDFMRNLQNRW